MTINKYMPNIWKIINCIVLGLLITICSLGTFYKHISFGFGLGDYLGYIVLYIGTILHLILFIKTRKKDIYRHILLSIIFMIFTVLIVLKATIWRGREYRWNGSIFYLPCPTEIPIDNQKVKKSKLIQMCTMDYYSEFSGNWDGKYLTIDKGEILIPKELENYIKQPIQKVDIESDFKTLIEDNEIIEDYYFSTDTLHINRKYRFAGKICKIRNNIPVLRVVILQQ